jgi:hypothetical protein
VALALLVIPHWNPANREERSIDNPSWEQVEAAIRALNNSDLNDLYLYPRQDSRQTYLCIGGGAGRYVVIGLIEDSACPTLVDPARSVGPGVELRLDGELDLVPNNWVMDLPTTVKAAKAFFEAGNFDCGIDWQMI